MKKKIIMLLSVVLSVLLMSIVFTGCEKVEDGKTQDENDSSMDAVSQIEVKEFSEDELLKGKHHVEMEIQDVGVVKLELDADQAPVSVTNFCQLAKSGFYDGLTFHRILTGSLVQGGSNTFDAMGSMDYAIKGEFSSNGVENNISHKAGAISMARSMEPDSAGSQFFICTDDCSYYDGEYAAFGQVTEGLEFVEQICNNTPVQDSNGTVAREDQPVIAKITVLD